MPIVHYLNVKNGDCSIIEHASGRITMIDTCNARKSATVEDARVAALRKAITEKAAGSGNHNEKANPVNPLEYMRLHNYNGIFRFILTGPDMDHMDGIKDLFEVFSPTNFWDTDNAKEMTSSWNGSPYREEDWKYYKNLRDSKPGTDPKRLALLSGATGKFFNQNDAGESGGDGLHPLAPTQALIDKANELQDWNDSSCVILYRAPKARVLFSGDSHDRTWAHLLEHHRSSIENIDLLIAPHHGRKSGRDYSFLDVVKPRLTFFGNASSEHLAYDAWSSRKLPYITNNQAGSMIVDVGIPEVPVYVTNEGFAKQRNPMSTYSDRFRGWHLQNIK